VAYINSETGLCDTNPHANTKITTSSLFIMANDDNPPTTQAIQQALANISS